MKHPEIKYNESTNTFRFGRYKYLTYQEAVQKREKYFACVAQLRENEVLVCYQEGNHDYGYWTRGFTEAN